jgi:hypothetical protein
LCSGSAQVSNSSDGFPQKPQASPFLFSIGFWLAQVPANSPSFFAQSLMAIPATPSANNPIVNNINFIQIVSVVKVQIMKFINIKYEKTYYFALRL